MRGGDVAHVDPEHHGARLGNIGPPVAPQQRDDALVGRVDAVGRREVVHDGAKDERRVDGREVERGPLRGHKVPRGALGERLGHAVAGHLVGGGVLGRVGVPRRLGVDDVVVEGLAGVEDGGKRRRDDDAAHVRRVPLDAAQDAGGAVDGRVDELGPGVGEVVVERRGRVQDGGEGGAVPRQDVVKGRRHGNVADGHDRQAPRGHELRVRGRDGVGLGLAAHRGDDGVALGEELLEDVGGDEAGATWKKK